MTSRAEPRPVRRRSPSLWFAVAIAITAGAPSRSAAKDVPVPPAPAGTKRLQAPPAPAKAAATAVSADATAATAAAAAASGERCVGCHSALAQGRVVHGALQKHDCTSCHRPVPTEAGKCKSRTSSKWALIRTEPELCYGCHARKDQSKSVHTAIRQGSCLSCHAAHSSGFAGLLSQPREKVCFDCHDADSLATKPVKHAPVGEGRCLECHDAHGGNLPNNVRAESGNAFCLRCHDAKAPTGKGTPGPRYRIDLGKKVVHAAFKRTDCLGCHDGGHGSDNLKFLKKSAADLCYGCHQRKDRSKFPHGAVLVGDCVVCHDPHSSDNPKLVAKPTTQETCFLCHQDDLTARKVVHAPVTKGCDQCHDPHGAANRFGLKGGEGKAVCYKCHKPVDGGKVKHAALERYGCVGCHDPHGTGNPALLARSVNQLCSSCHPEQKDGRHVTQISARPHVVGGGGLRDPRRAGREFSCASCHNPHGSDSPKLFYFGDDAMQACAWCHGDKTGKRPELKPVTELARPKVNPDGSVQPVRAGSGSGSPGPAERP